MLALKNLTSKTTRTICSILAISIGLGTAISIFTLDYNTILSQRHRLKSQYGNPDLELKPLNRYRADIAGLEKKLKDMRGIKSVTPIFFRHTNLYLDQTKPLNILLCGFTPQGNKRFNAYRLINGHDLPEGKTNTILLTSSLAKRYHINLGDHVYLKKPGQKVISTKCLTSTQLSPEPPDDITSKQWGEFKVVGFIAPDHLGRKNGHQIGIIPFYTGAEFLQSIFPFFWAQTTDGYSHEKLKAELGDLVNINKPSFAIIGESSMERAFRSGVLICGLFALGLGLFVVFNSFSMSLMERIKQIGLLKLVGANLLPIP